MRPTACAAIMALLPLAAIGGETLVLSDGHVRSGNPRSAAAYLAIENRGAGDCHLRAVESELAARVELHRTLDDGGVMKMVPLAEGITIPAGETRHLRQGGDHVMMMGLHAPVAEGQLVPLSLDFGECGTVALELPVTPHVAPRGQGAAHH